MRWLSRLVTAGIVIALVAIGVLMIRARMPSTQVGGGFRTYALFRDGSRLQPGSPVVIAGVRIGDITDISIQGRFARVDMRVLDHIQLPVESFITRRADSLFGDSYVEIIPPAAEDAKAVLTSGAPIQHVVEGGSTDSVLRAMERSLPRMNNALDTAHGLAVDGRQWVNGPFDDRLNEAAAWLTEGHIESPLTRTNDAFERLDRLTTAGAEAIVGSGPEVASQLRRIDDAVTSARQRMAELKTSLATAMEDARAGMDQLDPTVADMVEVISAIDRGEGDDWRGTLGRLVNDPELADTLEDAAAGGAEAVHGFNRFKSWIGARVELGRYSKQFRFYATAEIRARQDKFYLVEFSKSSLGGVPEDRLTDAAGTAAYTRTQVIRDELRFTAQFGKQFSWMQVRGGLKDSTFGFGADALLGDGRLRFSADVFGSFQRTPRLKLAAALAVFRSIYIVGGVDDALNEPGYLPIVRGNTDVPVDFGEVRHGRDYFLGAQLLFNDADLATMLRLYGALLVGLL